MKRFLLLTTIFFSFLLANAADWIAVTSNQPAPANIKLDYSDINRSVIDISLDGFYTLPVNTPRGEAVVIGLPEATPVMKKGAPDLPKFTTSLIIPDHARMEVNVLSSRFKVYHDVLVAPSKGNLTRDINPGDVPFEYGEEYDINADFPSELSKLREPYIIRDHRGQAVVVQPFSYNPVTKELKVYYEMKIEVKKVDDNGINPLVRKEEPAKMDRQFKTFYQTHFLNAGSTRYTPVDEEGCMLIISYADFMPAMEPFIQWKKQTGREVEMVDVATIGNSSAIKTYIADYYDSHDLAYVLLVGDAAQVPSSSAFGDSDNNYVYIKGNDHYPDAFIGRFSAENIGHVETQVERTIAYEKTPNISQDWFSTAIGIASDQGPGDDGEYDYEHMRNIHDDLLGYTYTYAHELFDGSQGGEDAPGNPSPSQVGQAIDGGASIINYVGHGSTTSWGTSGYSNTNIGNLSNYEMWPFIWSVACINGDFVSNTCFAEAWLRAEDNGQPTGAVATLMSTVNQSWNPPMHGQDEMNDILVESYTDNIKRTFGALSMNGCMEMNDEYGSEGDDMTDTWTCFGDPSVMVRTAMPQNITATFQPTLFLGQSSLTITSNAEGGLAVLLKNGEIFATAEISGGSAELQFNELTNVGTLDLTITCFNYIPLIDEIEVVPANTPYLIYQAHEITDTVNNGNHIIEPGERIFMTVDLKNVGGVDAMDVDVDFAPDCEHVSCVDSTENYGDILAGNIMGVDNAFCFDVDADAADQTPIPVEVTATDTEGESWTCTLNLKISAPVLSIGNMTIDDVAGGNGNGMLDPGEEVFLKVTNYNIGHSLAYNGVATLSSNNQYIEFITSVDSLGTVSTLGSTTATFHVQVDEDAPIGVVEAEFDYEIVAGMYSASAEFNKEIGLLFEDFETASFEKFNWEFAGNKDWRIAVQSPYEGAFCAESGDISDNQTTVLQITQEIMLADTISFYKRVSSESGDKLKFYINGTLKGQWSGVGEGYSREAYAVSPGNKTFKWVYEKNASGSQGGDYAKVDYIVFPPVLQLMATAGYDDHICAGETYQCQGEAYDYVNLEWSTSGSGTFNDNTILEPVYTPSSEDILNGNVVLSLTAWNDEGNSVDDDLQLVIYDKPAQPITPQGPEYVDVLNTLYSDYITEAVAGATEYVWELMPEEAGNIQGTTINATVEWNSDYLGTATVKVKALNECDESIWSEELQVMVDNATIISEISGHYNMKIYPNPVNDLIRIEAEANAGEDITLKLFDAFGRLIRQDKLQLHSGTNNFNMEAGDIPAGIYFLQIAGEQTTVKKLIKK